MESLASHAATEKRVFTCGPALLLALLMLSGCGAASEAPRLAVEELALFDAGLRVVLNRPAELERIVVRSPNGELLQELPVAGGRMRYEAPFRWQADRVYVVNLVFTDQVLTETILAPAEAPPLKALIELPIGLREIEIGDVSDTTLLAPPDGGATIALVIENRRQAPARFQMELDIPERVTLTSEDPRLKIDPGRAVLEGKLLREFDFVEVRARLELTSSGLSPGDEQPNVVARFQQWDESDALRGEATLTVFLRSAAADELASLVDVGDVVFPADERGERRPEQLADAVVLPNPLWSAVRGALRPSSTMFNFYEPYAFQAVWLTNRSDAPLVLSIETAVHDAATGEPLLDFAVPEWLSPRASATREHLFTLAPGEAAPAVMPLYVRPTVQPGEYTRTLRVGLLGSNEPLVDLAQPLEVMQGDAVVSTIVVAALTVSVLAWAAMFLWGQRLVARIGTEGLTRIGLIGGLYFVVSYTSRIGGALISGVAGPFYIFIAGVGNEGLTCLLLAVMIVLLPRPGTLALASGTVFFLNAMFTGQIGLVDFVFVTVSIVLGEIALLAAGLTVGSRLQTPRPTAPPGVIVRMALAIGLANGATLYVQYCLIQVLHRLFFANWYVIAAALVTGLLYGGLGAAAGTVFGYRLRRTAR